MKEVVLPSGAVLKITLSPFITSRALYQALLEDMKGVRFSMEAEVENVMKDMLCTALSSPKIEKAVWECLKKCTYNDLRVTEETFEPEEARQDYVQVMFEVTKENISPFTKNLYAQYAPLLEMLKQKPQA